MREVWYPQNSKKHTAVTHRWKSRNRQKMYATINDLKRKPCSDCCKRFPPICMDFDHVPGRGRKIADIASAIQRDWSLEKIMKEIAKCDLVCSNCHRVRTAMRKPHVRFYLAA